MDLTQHVPLGRTGLTVSRIGLASGYGVPTPAIEQAFHEHGVNYFYVSLLRKGNMVRAIRNLKAQRDALRIVLSKPAKGGYFLRGHVERWLKKLRVEQADLMILGSVNRPPTPLLIERAQALVDSGKVRFIGMSSHERPLFGQLARGELRAPIDVFQLRYNAVHTGAEQDIFPHLPKQDRPGIVVFTATCWRKLLRPRLMPPGEQPLAPADCYRFVLSHPDVDVCVTGPSSEGALQQNLRALSAGPLDEQEMARVRRIGQHIYGKK